MILIKVYMVSNTIVRSNDAGDGRFWSFATSNRRNRKNWKRPFPLFVTNCTMSYFNQKRQRSDTIVCFHFKCDNDKLLVFQVPAVDIFCGSSSEELPLAHYIHHVSMCSFLGPSCVFAAKIYLDRFETRSTCRRLTTKTAHRLLLVALMTAQKFLEDISCSNKLW